LSVVVVVCAFFCAAFSTHKPPDTHYSHLLYSLETKKQRNQMHRQIMVCGVTIFCPLLFLVSNIID
jgi:hypothetical protein